MRSTFLSVLLPILLSSTSVFANSEPPKPCTIFSPFTGAYYDLNTIAVQPLVDHKPAHKDDRTESWHARGYDYGTNFTVNFCRPVIEDISDVVDVDASLWKNISAYYKFGEKTFSIGQQSSEPVFRGRKLVLNYTGGSPCDGPLTKFPRKLIGDDDDDHKKDDDDDDHKKDDDHEKDDKDKDDNKKDDDRKHDNGGKKDNKRRKSSIISFLCERDSLAPSAHLSFIGASEDECTYFFEAKAKAACGGVNETQQSLGPGGVFGVIALIAAAVYLIGGIAYQRTVMHQRGWRQLPNYSTWAGIGNFLWEVVIILTSSCSRLLPRRQGYNQLPTHSRSRSSRAEDENRLIDQLDEEWDD